MTSFKKMSSLKKQFEVLSVKLLKKGRFVVDCGYWQNAYGLRLTANKEAIVTGLRPLHASSLRNFTPGLVPGKIVAISKYVIRDEIF